MLILKTIFENTVFFLCYLCFKKKKEQWKIKYVFFIIIFRIKNCNKKHLFDLQLPHHH